MLQTPRPDRSGGIWFWSPVNNISPEKNRVPINAEGPSVGSGGDNEILNQVQDDIVSPLRYGQDAP